MPLPPGSQAAVADLLLDGATALGLDGHAAAVPVLGQAITGLLADQSDSADALLWLGIGCWAAGTVGDDTSLHELATRLEHLARENGALARTVHRAPVPRHVRAALTARSMRSGRASPSGPRSWPPPGGRPMWESSSYLPGEGAKPRRGPRRRRVTRYATEHGHGWMLSYVDYALAVLELGLGNYRAAPAQRPEELPGQPLHRHRRPSRT